MNDVVFRSAESARRVETAYRAVLDAWPVEKTELTVETGQGPTFVIASGTEGAPALVLCHGSQANAAAWMPDMARWASTFRVFAIDMIGEAGLSARVRPPLEGDGHALWLDDVLAGIGVESAGFVGTSLGGWLAADYATRRPETVRALALMCPAGIGRQKNFLLKAAPLLLFGAWGKRKFRKQVFGPKPPAFPQTLQPMADLMELIGQAVKPRIVRIPQLTDAALSRLKMPVLAIVGERDVLLDSRDTRDRLQRAVPHAEVDFIENGYHFLPSQTGQIMRFMERTLI